MTHQNPSFRIKRTNNRQSLRAIRNRFALGINNQALFQYMEDSDMPWLAVLPQSNRASALAQRYGIQFIPTLIIIDDATKTISFNGREEVVQSGAAAYDAWLTAR